MNEAVPETKPVTSVEAQTALLDAVFHGKYIGPSHLAAAIALLQHHDLIGIADALDDLRAEIAALRGI